MDCAYKCMCSDQFTKLSVLTNTPPIRGKKTHKNSASTNILKLLSRLYYIRQKSD